MCFALFSASCFSVGLVQMEATCSTNCDDDDDDDDVPRMRQQNSSSEGHTSMTCFCAPNRTHIYAYEWTYHILIGNYPFLGFRIMTPESSNTGGGCPSVQVESYLFCNPGHAADCLV